MSGEDTSGQGSILDGIDVGERRTLDRDWSKQRKIAVGGSAVVLAVAAVVGGGVFMINARPPGLPRTADEAIAVMASAKFERLDEDRQEQYIAQARTLIDKLPEDERRALFQDDASREAGRQIREQMVNDFVYALARGENPQMAWGRGRGGNANGGERRGGGGDGERRRDPRNMSADMRARISDSIMTSLQSGNAQANALRGEMFQRRMGQRGRRAQQNNGDG